MTDRDPILTWVQWVTGRAKGLLAMAIIVALAALVAWAVGWLPR